MTNLVDLRGEEFNCVKHYFQPGIHVLEIGGGNGFQASLITSLGANVKSIDVAEQPRGTQIYFPVGIYDGRTLPFPDHVFDMVFSSNVLEHIRDLEATLAETKRVMKADGLAIHILPTPTWRIWTSLSHYVHIIKRIADAASGRRDNAAKSSSVQTENLTRTVGTWNVIERILRDGPHGEYPSALSELWYFSHRRWAGMFRRNGFEVIETMPSNIFYTGYGVFPRMPLGVRRVLAHLLGSATRIFVLRKAP